MAEFSPAPRQTPSARHLLRGKIEVARILSLPPAEFAGIIDELEKSPLFQKLFSAEHGLKIIHRKSFSRAALSSRFYELDENRASAPGGDVQKILDHRKRLVELIRRMGQDRFEKYFLHDDGAHTREQIIAECGLKESEFGAVRKLVDEVFLETEILAAKPQEAPAPAVAYSNIAQVMPDPKEGFTIAFFSPMMARGTYQVNHQKLEEVRRKGALTAEEKRALNAILSRISLINARKNSLYQLILRVVEHQKPFFSDEDPVRLSPLTQRKISSEIRFSPSSISRLIYGRSIEGPSGREYPIEQFFLSRKAWTKQRLKALVAENADLTDEQVRHIIKKRFGIALSRRSVNQYRRELSPKAGRKA